MSFRTMIGSAFTLGLLLATWPLTVLGDEPRASETAATRSNVEGPTFGGQQL